MRYSSRAERQAEVTPAEEYLVEEPTVGSSAEEPPSSQGLRRRAHCAWCGRNERSHSPRQLAGCRERLAIQAGRLR